MTIFNTVIPILMHFFTIFLSGTEYTNFDVIQSDVVSLEWSIEHETIRERAS